MFELGLKGKMAITWLIRCVMDLIALLPVALRHASEWSSGYVAGDALFAAMVLFFGYKESMNL